MLPSPLVQGIFGWIGGGDGGGGGGGGGGGVSTAMSSGWRRSIRIESRPSGTGIPPLDWASSRTIGVMRGAGDGASARAAAGCATRASAKARKRNDRRRQATVTGSERGDGGEVTPRATRGA